MAARVLENQIVLAPFLPQLRRQRLFVLLMLCENSRQPRRDYDGTLAFLSYSYIKRFIAYYLSTLSLDSFSVFTKSTEHHFFQSENFYVVKHRLHPHFSSTAHAKI